MMKWNTKSWWQRALLLSIGWLLTAGACMTGIMAILRNSLSEGDRYEIQSAFMTIAVAGLCALWFAYWMGRKTMPGSPGSP